MIRRIASGRTDLVVDYLAAGNPPTASDDNGVPLIQWCAYYGDVSALKWLLDKGESIETLGSDSLNEAAFHGHWQLCEFLIESGVDVNRPLSDTEETPLHSALCTSDRSRHDLVVRVLLKQGADPNLKTKPGVETGGFMRDARTKGETPLHRAAAFGTEATIQLLLDAGSIIDSKDVNGDSPLTWASWYTRPTPVLKKLCYGDHSVRADRTSMKLYLLGMPNV